LGLRERWRRHRKDNRFIVGGLVVLLAVLTAFYYLLQRGKDLPGVLLTNRVLLFVLWYVNVVLILTVLFVLVRNLFRLLLERHDRILGSKFKTKLVLTAFALSLIPVLILFPFATRLLLDAVEQWFSLPIEEVVSQAADTAEGLRRQIESTTRRDARRALGEIEAFDLRDLDERPALQRRLDELRLELELDYLGVYDGLDFIHASADPRTVRRQEKLDERSLREALAAEEGSTKLEDELGVEGRMILVARAAEPRAAEPAGLPASEASTEPQRAVVVAGKVIGADLAEKSEKLILAYQTYRQLEVQKDAVRSSYFMILLMVTLLVMLAFSSIGLRLARRVTAPIQALADGTRRVSSGDLDHRVEVEVDDELGVLVDAFNHMTAELKRNRELVERSNRELVETNARLTEERLLFSAVLQNVPAGVVTVDTSGRILTCNGAALEILNQSAEDVAGQHLAEAWSDPERGKLAQLLENGAPEPGVSTEVRLTVGGVWKTLEVKLATLPDSSGRRGVRVAVIEDQTELIHAQKMATWNEVARRIAHEIKNPLTPIRLTAERLLRKHQQGDGRLGEMVEEGAEIIVREVSSLKNMVDEFSRFARMPRPQPKEVDLEKLVAETVQLYQGLKPGLEVTTEIAPEAATARFDPDQLKAVLINLLDNAVAATEPPGEIRVTTAAGPGGGVELAVADTGTGIRAEDRAKLFLPYYSTKGRGSGLGLAIVHRIVTDHNANLRVDDNPPKGSVFTVEIPEG